MPFPVRTSTNDRLLPALSLYHPPGAAPVIGYMILLSRVMIEESDSSLWGACYCIPNGPGWAGHQGESLHTWLVKQTWGLATETDSEGHREGNKMHNTAFDHCLKDTVMGFIFIYKQKLSRGGIYTVWLFCKRILNKYFVFIFICFSRKWTCTRLLLKSGVM